MWRWFKMPGPFLKTVLHSHIVISFIHFEFLHFAPFHIHHTNLLYALGFALYALTVLYKCGLCQRENGKVKCRNGSDLYKKGFGTIIRIIGMINVWHVRS